MTLTVTLAGFTVWGAPQREDQPEPAAPQIQEHKEQCPGKHRLLDINTATEAELKALEGVTGTHAKKIIAGRPYSRKDQLKTREIIPTEVYESIKDKITVKLLKIAT